jgi:hypothetical protein
MSAERWSDVIVRVTREAPADLDDLIHDPAGERGAGREIFPLLEADPMPAAPMAREDAVAVGFRVTGPLDDVADRAVRLASFALEEDVEVIILSHVEDSGFERFGFRVERIVGASEEARAACEAQIRRFWNIDLVL